MATVFPTCEGRRIRIAGRSEAWISRHTGGVEIAGSNPVGPIFRKPRNLLN